MDLSPGTRTRPAMRRAGRTEASVTAGTGGIYHAGSTRMRADNSSLHPRATGVQLDRLIGLMVPVHASPRQRDEGSRYSMTSQRHGRPARVLQRIRHAGLRPVGQRSPVQEDWVRRGLDALGRRSRSRVGHQRHQTRQPERRAEDGARRVRLVRQPETGELVDRASATRARASIPRASPIRLRPRTC